MSTKPTENANKATSQQEVRIDLPGEKVGVWLSGSKVLVTLRKHRDIIFDFKLGDGKSYVVESTDSDFYNANTKKIVFAKRKETVTFKDGERLHLWITRNFKGFLTIKCENNLVLKFEPNKVDQHQYDEEPKTKPAPIIFSLGNSSPPVPSLTKKTPTLNTTPQRLTTTPAHPAASAPVDEDCPIVCVVEGKIANAPQQILDYFKKGGGSSGLADIDINNVSTRNWILGQIAGVSAYTRDNWSWLRASIDGKTHQGFRLVRAKMHMVRGKVRFYFSGYSKFNTVFGPGGFGPGHDRILSIFAGAGKTSSSFKAVGKGVLGSLRGNALVSFIFSSATAIAEWKDDVSKDGYDLTANLLVGLLKTLIVAAITIAVVALLVMAILALASVSLTVLAIGALTIAIGIGISYIIDVGDKASGKAISGDKNNTDGLAGVLAPLLRKAQKEIESSWTHLMEKLPTDYPEMLL